MQLKRLTDLEPFVPFLSQTSAPFGICRRDENYIKRNRLSMSITDIAQNSCFQ